MTFDWTINIGGILGGIGALVTVVGAGVAMVRRICGRLEGIEQQGAVLSQRMGQHQSETTRRLDELRDGLGELRAVLLRGEGR